MYKVQVTPLIGLPRFDGWAHVTTISSGNIVFALSVEGQHARNIGRDLVDLINQNEAISSGAELYKLVTKIIRDAQDKEGALSLACGYLVQDGKSTFCVFNGSISLKRDGKSGQLLQSTQLQIIEGNTQLEDIYVFATTQAGQFLGEVRQKFDQGYDADTIVTSITPSLHLEETTATSAMAFVDFRDFVEEKKIETKSIPVKPVPISTPTEDAELPVFFPDVESNQPTERETPSTTFNEREPDNELLEAAFWLSPSSTEVTEPVSTPSQKSKKRKIEFTKSIDSVQVFFKRVLAAGLTFGLTLFAALSKIASWRPPVAGEVYVGKAANDKKIRVFLLVGLVALVVLAGGGFFFYQRSQKTVEASALLEPFILEIQQVKAQVESNPIEARQKLQQVISEMETLESTLGNNQIAQKKVTLSLNDARKLYDDISGREEFSELPIFFTSRDQDLDILITDSELADDQFVFFDRQKKQGVLVDNQGSVVSTFSSEIESEIKDISVEFGLDDVWLLADKVFVTDPTQDKAPTEELEDEERLSESSILAAFGNALYIFNADERTLFKYSQNDDGFSDPVRWIRSAPGLDFEQIVDMVIDGDVWLTTNTGEVFKLRGGNKQDFSFSGLEQPFVSSVYMYSQEEFENLYFLEPAESRVVITSKDGVFSREITSSSLAAASHIIVSADETKLLAISGSTVYLIEL